MSSSANQCSAFLETVQKAGDCCRDFKKNVVCDAGGQIVDITYNPELPVVRIERLAEITGLSQLKFHDIALADTVISTFDSIIPKLTNLRNLSIMGSHLKAVPPSIFRSQLTALDLSNNNITDLPTELFTIVSLTHLKLSQNNLSGPIYVTSIPPHLSQCEIAQGNNLCHPTRSAKKSDNKVLSQVASLCGIPDCVGASPDEAPIGSQILNTPSPPAHSRQTVIIVFSVSLLVMLCMFWCCYRVYRRNRNRDPVYCGKSRESVIASVGLGGKVMKVLHRKLDDEWLHKHDKKFGIVNLSLSKNEMGKRESYPEASKRVIEGVSTSHIPNTDSSIKRPCMEPYLAYENQYHLLYPKGTPLPVLFSFEARSEDEVTLNEGDWVILSECYDDLWATGKIVNHTTQIPCGNEGTIPLSCIGLPVSVQGDSSEVVFVPLESIQASDSATAPPSPIQPPAPEPTAPPKHLVEPIPIIVPEATYSIVPPVASSRIVGVSGPSPSASSCIEVSSTVRVPAVTAAVTQNYRTQNVYYT